MNTPQTFTAFAGHERIAAGEGPQVATAVQALAAAADPRTLLIFADGTGEQMDLDLLGPAAAAQARLQAAGPESPPAPRGPGRPRLGVVGREVTLLPRHWEWLNAQPGGASVALRKLVDQARRDSGGRDRIRRSREAAYRFMTALGGNLPGFEEACRALFAGDGEAFAARVADWPSDVRDYAGVLAAAGLAGE